MISTDYRNATAPQVAASGKPAAKHDPQQLSAEQLQQLQKLKARDQEVKSHEQAHLSAAGSLAAGPANFTYQTGPDGHKYAIGGEVNINMAAVSGDPAATLRKADIIRRAALAPSQPSDQDRAVAQQAASMALKAQAELQQQPDQTETSNIHYTV